MLSAAVVVAQAPAPAPVPNTRAIAEGVYIFEYRGYQSMFVVDPQGVIVTDPISPDTAKVYLAEVRKITQAPIRYVVYSHHHYDHISGGAVFKDAGATFVSHKNARPQLERLQNSAVVRPSAWWTRRKHSASAAHVWSCCTWAATIRTTAW